MKKLMLLFIITGYFFCFSETKIERFDGELWGIDTDGKNVYSLVLYKGYQKLQTVYPFRAETEPLCKFKSYYRYYQLINDKIITLFDNNVFVYDTSLKIIKKIKLPKDEIDYHFNYYLSTKNSKKNKFCLVITNSINFFVLNDFDITVLGNQITAYGNKIELVNNHVTINGNQTKVKYRKFSQLIGLLFVLNSEHILVRNILFDKNGRLLSTLPFSSYVRHAVFLDDQYILPNSDNIVVLNKKGEIIKVIDEESPGVLGILDQDHILFSLNNHDIGILSLKTLTVQKKDLGEEIADVVLVNDNLCYIPRSDWKILKIIPLKDIFVE